MTSMMGKVKLLIIFLVFIPSLGWGSPFLVCDPQAGVEFYRLTGPAWITSPVPAQPDGSIRMDVSGASIGVNDLTVSACKTDPLWGEQCASVPFSFTRPSGPLSPSNTRLVP